MKIIRSRRKTISLSLDREGNPVVRAPLFCSGRVIEEFIARHQDWIERRQAEFIPPKVYSQEELSRLRRAAKEEFPSRVAHFAPLVGVAPKGIKITSARTRYGSCSSTGNLCFSLFLMEKSARAIDYVVVHELCHLKRMDHSPAFYREIEKILPDYRERMKELKK